MPLRTRLVLATGAVIATLVVGMLTVIESQRELLVGQLDSQLLGLLPISELPAPDSRRPLPAPPVSSDAVPGRDGERVAPVEGLLIGRVQRDGAVTPFITGWPVEDQPALTVDHVSRAAGTRQAFDVDGKAGMVRFRVMATPTRDRDGWGIVALPTTDVDAAVGRLVRTLGAVAAVIIAAAVATGWWVVRLGLRPIARVTRAADTIASGERTHRVDGEEARTEAGRLAHAFNVMLDERDEAEGRLRQFVADAAHELRTPLTTVRGYLDLLHQGAIEPGASADAVSRMRRESERMRSLVEDLLLLAKLDHGRPLARRPVDLAEVLRDAADDARAVQPDRSVILCLNGGHELLVNGDEPRLRQVVAELVHNALVHTSHDAAVELRGRIAGDDVVVTVADTGAGLAPEVSARVFDRFFRGNPSRSRDAGGSGLGLPIARAVIEAHGGTVGFDSVPDSGTTIALRIPRLAAAAAEG